MYCPKCGKLLRDDMRFCIFCGEAQKPFSAARGGAGEIRGQGGRSSDSYSPSSPWITDPGAQFEYEDMLGSALPSGSDSQLSSSSETPDSFGGVPGYDLTPQAVTLTGVEPNSNALRIPAWAVAIVSALGVIAIAIVVVIANPFSIDVLNPAGHSSQAASSSGEGMVIDSSTFKDEGILSFARSVADSDGDGLLSEEERLSLTVLDAYGVERLDDLALFPNLETVKVRGTNLTAAEFSGLSSLSSIDVADNGALKALSIGSMPALQTLICSDCASLERIAIEDAPALLELDAKGSSVARIDLPAECPIATINVNPTTYVANLPDRFKVDRLVLTSYKYSQTDDVTSKGGTQKIDVKAEYDEDGYVTRKTLLVEGPENSAFRHCSLRPGVLKYEYDDAKRLVSVEVVGSMGSDGVWNIAYADNGRSVHAERPALAGTGDPYYIDDTYDANGNLISREYSLPDGDKTTQGSVKLEYDSDDRLISYTTSGTGSESANTYSLTYKADGSLQGAVANGTTYEFFDDGSLRAVRYDTRVAFVLYKDNGEGCGISSAYYENSYAPRRAEYRDFYYDDTFFKGSFGYDGTYSTPVTFEAQYQTMRVAPWTSVTPAANLFNAINPIFYTDPFLGLFGDYRPFGMSDAVQLNRIWLATHTVSE